ncbi:MAG: hypothetical protein Q8S84_06020 [bacterium]|nr:hypothetical protein [bacterium]MDP3381036.1 hypothetical protein [bacterium]
MLFTKSYLKCCHVNSAKLFTILVICLLIANWFFSKSVSLKNVLSLSFHPGSQIIPVAHQVKAIYLFHLLII